ncbi:MAG TPA: RNA-binding protein [Bacteroidales bacterium]|nr:RNA-binding protein [Bacteroidales bacterium]
MNIYVGNLDFKVNEDDLQALFEEYGTVNSSKIITDKYSGKSKGFGFVEMENDSEANEAIKNLSGSVMENREIIVNEAKPRRNRY